MTLFGQGIACDANVSHVAADPSGTSGSFQLNANFDSLSRAVACLQRALTSAEVGLAAARSEAVEARRELADLRRQVAPVESIRSVAGAVTVRACRSGEADIVYLPDNIACGRLGETWEADRGGLPVYQVVVP
jgi:hypothetical protein